MLASLDVFVALADRQFQNSALSETLRSDVPGSVRHYTRWLGAGFHWRTVGDLDYSVRTGKPALAVELFATARLKLNRIIETPTLIGLLEAVNA